MTRLAYVTRAGVKKTAKSIRLFNNAKLAASGIIAIFKKPKKRPPSLKSASHVIFTLSAGLNLHAMRVLWTSEAG
ncbi:MAG: hypothetical protein WC837_03970 [Bellilinea sp.]